MLSWLYFLVNNFNFLRAYLPIRPFDTDVSLLIYANGILPCPVALEAVKTVAWQGAQSVESWR
jgi:hypothetical protein